MYNVSDINTNSLSFGAVKSLDNGGKILYMNHNNKPLVFAINQMHVPFGLSVWDNANAGANVKYNINLSFPEGDDTLLDKIKGVEDRIIDEAFANSKAWFKKSYTSRAVVAELFTSCIKYPKENGEISQKYRPTIQLTLPFKNGAFECQAYSADRTAFEISKETITKGSKMEAIVQFSCIWMAGTKFGCTMKVLQMKVTPSRGTLVYAFVDDEDDA